MQAGLRTTTEQQKIQYDKSKIHKEFVDGDLVLLNADGITLDAKCNLPRTLGSKFIGPFPITERKGRLVYVLDMSNVQTKVFNEFHVSVLKQYIAPTDDRELARPPAVIPETDSYEVDCILRKRIHRKKEQYLVRWKGYNDDECTWQSLADLKGAKEALREFRTRSI